MNLSFEYLIVHDLKQSADVAVFYFQKLRFTSSHFGKAGKQPLWMPAVKFLTTTFRFTIAVCGNLFAVQFPGFHFRKQGVESYQKNEILALIVNEVQSSTSAVLFKDTGKESQLFEAIGLSRWPDDLTMRLYLDNQLKNENQYVAALNHKYRQRYKLVRKKGSFLERRELSLPEMEAEAKRIDELHKNTVAKQSIRLGVVTHRYLLEMKRFYGERMIFIGYYKDHMIGFASFIRRTTHLEFHYLGIDYTKNHDYKLYFNMLYDSIDLALQFGLHEIELGRTSRTAKSALGATPDFFNSYYRIYNFPSRWIVKLLSKNFNSLRSQEMLRHPYKK